MTNFSTVFAEEITEEKNSKFELMLLDKYEQNREGYGSFFENQIER